MGWGRLGECNVKAGGGEGREGRRSIFELVFEGLGDGMVVLYMICMD